MAFKNSPKHIGRRVAATLAVAGAGTGIGGALGNAASKTKEITEYTRVPNVNGEGLGTLVPHAVQAATTASEQLNGTKLGAALGLAATAGGMLYAHHVLNKHQFGGKK
jgi:hypothetical protein